MKSTTILTFAASIASSVEAIHLVERRDAAPAVFGLDIERVAIPDPVSRDRLRRRQNTKTVEQTLDNLVRRLSGLNAGYAYFSSSPHLLILSLILRDHYISPMQALALHLKPRGFTSIPGVVISGSMPRHHDSANSGASHAQTRDLVSFR